MSVILSGKEERDSSTLLMVLRLSTADNPSGPLEALECEEQAPIDDQILITWKQTPMHGAMSRRECAYQGGGQHAPEAFDQLRSAAQRIGSGLPDPSPT
jgi:hypothetical protein